jgi:5-methylcytosine-specific restriction endonuclease McrA
METLLLSSTWEPIGRVDWERAMVLWFSGRAELVETYANQVIRTVSSTFEVPAVIRYVRGRHRRAPVVRFSRNNVYHRDEGHCQYCGLRLHRDDATYDHVVPKRAGGRTTWENITLSCRPCNQRKGGRTPEQAGMRLRSVPHRPRSIDNEWMLGMSLERMPAAWLPWIRSA